MHNTMRMVLSNIHNSIPEEILNIAFNPTNNAVSVDQTIITKVIKNRVLMECNLMAGVTKHILLTYAMIEPMHRTSQENRTFVGNFSVYRVPEYDRDFRPIVSVSAVNYPNYTDGLPYVYSRPGLGANAYKLGRAVLESHTMTSGLVVPTGKVLPGGGDLIQLTPAQHTNVDWLVTCRLAYDENFTDLNHSAVFALMDLTLSATKAYIYNRMAIVIDQARIIHGAEQGVIRDIISKYDSEEEKYKELLSEFSGGTLLSPERQQAMIRHMM